MKKAVVIICICLNQIVLADPPNSDQVRVPAGTSVKAVSNDGGLTILIDQGINPEAFEDIPNNVNPKDIPELESHYVYLINSKGDLIKIFQLPAPSAPPDRIRISPTGKWFTYCFRDKAHLYSVDNFQDTLIQQECGLQVMDDGKVYR